MKKYKVSVPTDYVAGHLRYGHYETEIEAESLEKVKEYINSNEGKEYIKEVAEFEVDDYEIDDIGDLDLTMVIIEEIKLEKSDK